MTLKIAVSSRSLFNIEDGDKIWREQGQDAFDQYMRENASKPLRPGVAFNLVRKLLALNDIVPEQKRVEVVLLSRNSADASMRVMASVEHHNLKIETGVFSGGTDRFRFAEAFGADLFLSANNDDVRTALSHGVAAATMCPVPEGSSESDNAYEHAGITFCLDGDAVVFSGESDHTYRTQGMDAYLKHELERREIPLGDGPFKALFIKLIELQKELPRENNPVRVALVTARGIQSHFRVMKTLNSWGVRLHEAVFCGGTPKGPVLRAMHADIFFDDTRSNIDSALAHQVSGACYVPNGDGGIRAEGDAAQ